MIVFCVMMSLQWETWWNVSGGQTECQTSTNISRNLPGQTAKSAELQNFHDLLIGSATKFRSHTDTDTIIIIIMIIRTPSDSTSYSMNQPSNVLNGNHNTNLLQFPIMFRNIENPLVLSLGRYTYFIECNVILILYISVEDGTYTDNHQ